MDAKEDSRPAGRGGAGLQRGAVGVLAAVLMLALSGCEAVPKLYDRIMPPSADEGPIAGGDDSRQGLEPGEDGVEDRPGIPPGEETFVEYEVEVLGADDVDGLEDLFAENGLLYRLQEEPPGTMLGLRRRVEADLETFREILRSQGYYAGEVAGRVDAGTVPATAIIEVTPGPRYTIAAFDVVYRDQPPPPGSPQTLADVPLLPTDPADADNILDVVEDLPGLLMARGFPFAEVVDTRFTVNHDENVLRAEVGMNAGPRARFGAVRFSGLEEVEESYLQTLVPWEPGQTWDEEELEAYRTALLASGLFRSLRMGHPDEVAADGTLPVEVEVAEAKMRSIGAGVKYSSDTGPGLTAFWEHRNYFGADEDLRVDLDLSTQQQELSGTFLKPAYLRPDQSLVAEASLANEDTDAYERTGLLATAGIERTFSPVWTGGVRGLIDVASIKEATDDEAQFVVLGGVPVYVRRDTSDDPLDPTQGTRSGITLTPFVGQSDQMLLFLKSEANASVYYSPLDSERLTLAARIGFGSIVGEDLDAIPADQRFFAGGGGSVRGFEYQSIGPQAAGEPTGGLSEIEASLEARIKVTDSIGIVPFFDAGQVYDSATPDFSRTFRYAAGIGARYYTAIGPMRLDVAVPLNARDDDDAYQFYLSIGQAF